MAKSVQKTVKNTVGTTLAGASRKKQAAAPLDVLDKMENWCSRHRAALLYTCLSAALLLSLLLFNAKITDGADDALYIEASYRYATGFFDYYYTFTAPLYCMFLALPVALFGLNLVVLKLFSVAFFVAGIYFLYAAFKNRIPNAVLFPALFLTALNSLFLFYASQTYTECFTLALTGVFFILFFKTDDVTEQGAALRANWRTFLCLGLAAFLLYMSRNVAAVIPVVMLAYFLFQKKYATAVYSLLSFLFFTLLYQQVIVPLCWGHLNLGSRFAGQGSMMWNKDAYNTGLGREDFGGMVQRFFENARIYFSQLFDITGLKSSTTPHSYLFAALIILLVAVGVAFAVRKNKKHVVAAAIYAATFLGASFISLHTSWAQHRLVMIYIPLIAVVVFYAFVALLKLKHARWLQWVYPAGLVVLLGINVTVDFKKVKENFPVLQHNLSGDKYYGFTPDWVNYFKMSEWAAATLPADEVVACRKASMSFVYTGGRSFKGITGVPSVAVDSALRDANFAHHFVGLVPDGMPQLLYDEIRPYMNALFISDNKMWHAYDLPYDMYQYFVAMITPVNVAWYETPEAMLAAVKKDTRSYAVYPDRLLDALRSDSVGYVINASLRTNPKQKTNNVITTITRFMYFIEQKYPGTFQKIHQIGSDNGEPAMIYKVME
jgi:hypothetical protein